MGMRFRKSLKLAPGVRMNFSGSGVSWSVGPRGASVGIGKRGTYLNTGIPGTGLYSRQRLDGGSATATSRTYGGHPVDKAEVTVRVNEDDGSVSFLDANGNPVPDNWVAAAKKQQGDVIRGLLTTACANINEQVEALGQLHHDTPNPVPPPKYVPATFDTPQPRRPIPRKPGFFASLFKRSRERIERENAAMAEAYTQAQKEWESVKRVFESSEAARKQLIDQDIYTDPDAMAEFLEGNLQDIVWPKETDVSFDIQDNGKRVFLDVDLPEIEDMPRKTASVPMKAYKLSLKEMSAGQVQKLYMQHVHGVGFRIIGETFAALPVAEEVVLSAYSQRPDPATGQIRDDYLYSVCVPRTAWGQIEFNNLPALNVVEALSRFELCREMSKTGSFKPIEPITP